MMTAKQALLEVARNYRRDAHMYHSMGMTQHANRAEATAMKLEARAEALRA